MNRLEETMPKMKSDSSPSSSDPIESLFSSSSSTSPALSMSPTDVPAKTNYFGLDTMFDFKTWLIVILVFVLMFSYLGINVLVLLGDTMQNFVDFVSPVITEFLILTGYSTGSVINKTADVVSDTAKETIDIAEGAVQNVGDLLMDAGKKRRNSNELDDTVQRHKGSEKTPEPVPDAPENTIQKPITSSKYNWCLVGEYQNKRGCMPITESDKCLSGQVFPTQKMCLNPNITKY